jgi:uncharacterized membrane protein YcaP (DUF421 family)
MVIPPSFEIVLRSVAVYLFILVAIRLFGKKELAQLSVIDLVFILLISNAVQNAMVGSDTSLSGGVVAALALFATNFVFKKLLYKSNKISEMIQGKSIMLVYEGNLISENLKLAEITLEEIEAAAREHGVEKITEVKLAILEVDGNISIVSSDFSNKRRTKPTKQNTSSKDGSITFKSFLFLSLAPSIFYYHRTYPFCHPLIVVQ